MESEGSNMPEPEKTPAPSEQTSKLGIFARLRAYFFAGVLVTAPIAITIALAVWIIGYIDDQIVPLIPQRYNPDTYFQQYLGVDFGLPGLGVLVLILAITLIGAFTAGLVGRWIVRFGEKLLDRMPIIRSLYKLTKQIFQTVLQNQPKVNYTSCYNVIQSMSSCPRRRIRPPGFCFSCPRKTLKYSICR